MSKPARGFVVPIPLLIELEPVTTGGNPLMQQLVAVRSGIADAEDEGFVAIRGTVHDVGPVISLDWSLDGIHHRVAMSILEAQGAWRGTDAAVSAIIDTFGFQGDLIECEDGECRKQRTKIQKLHDGTRLVVCVSYGEIARVSLFVFGDQMKSFDSAC